MAISGVARVAMPTAAGNANRKVRRKPQSSRAEYSVLSPSTFAFDRLGSKMVPRATPSMAVGNSIKRSAYDSQEMLPSASRDAMLVLIIRLICAAETANTAGPIFFSTRRTPPSDRPMAGLIDRRGSMPILISAGIWMATCSKPPTNTAIAMA